MGRSRIEADTLGRVRVPSGALYGAQTARAVENFPVSGRRFPPRFLRALASVKSACAEVNGRLRPDDLPPRLARAIRRACGAVAAGRHDDQFPVDLFQTGSGTSTNMNVNEVVANLANERLGGRRGSYRPVHPNDHVNLGQSSNDVMPSAVHVAVLQALQEDLRPALRRLHRSLRRKARSFDRVVKLGRTHLMDAVPIRLGQEFSGYAMQVEKGWERIAASSRGLRELAVGGTAVGTGLATHPRFGRSVVAILRKRHRIPFRTARNPFEAQAARDDLAGVSGALRTLAGAFVKIAEDVRWMGSGPAGGLGELRLPELQPGSSIMPGKVNPVMCEMLVQVGAQVVGNDAAVAAASRRGNFELNAMIPVLCSNVLDSISILAAGGRLFAERCVDGLVADAPRCRAVVERSPQVWTVLVSRLGHERTAEVLRAARAGGRSVKDVVVERGLLEAREAEDLFELRRMTGDGGS